MSMLNTCLSDMVPSKMMSALTFSQYTEEELLKISVKSITNAVTFDVLGHPNYGGLHDPAFGLTPRSLG